jgi:hypothetical protein
MNWIKKIVNAGFEVTVNVTKSKKISTKLLAQNLLFVFQNKDKFVNDLRINRYLKELKNKVKKNMATSITQGLGTSAALYYISTNTLINVLEKEVKNNEFARSRASKKNKSAFDTTIKYLNNDIEYFSKPEFKGKLFSLNGQHRMNSYIDDLSGNIGKIKTQEEYSPITIDGVEHTFDSLHDLYVKLCSTDNTKRYEQIRMFSVQDGQEIFEAYLEDCELYIVELTDADSFESISNFIWYSNTSTAWSLFEHSFKQVKNPFTTYVMNEVSSNDTGKHSPIEELIYKKSGIDWGTGKFKKTAGGFEYLLALTFDTCYNPESSSLLQKFAFRTPDELLKTVLSSTFVVSENELKQWKTLLVSVSKVFQKLNKEAAMPVAKDIMKKPSSIINSIFLIRWLENEYGYKALNGNYYKVKLHQDSYEKIIRGYITLAVRYSNPMHPINTYFWDTSDGIKMLKSINQNTPFISKDGIKDPAFHNKFEVFLKECGKHQRDKNDSDLAFRKHIGDSFVYGWNKDHECVVRKIKEYLDKAFVREKEELKEPTGFFGNLAWVDNTPMVDSKFLLPSINDDDFMNSLWVEQHRGHNTAKSKGGSNKIENIELENPEINILTKNVV